MPVLQTRCSECLGCNKLEMPDFKEVYRCENFVKGVKNEFKQVSERRNGKNIWEK